MINRCPLLKCLNANGRKMLTLASTQERAQSPPSVASTRGIGPADVLPAWLNEVNACIPARHFRSLQVQIGQFAGACHCLAVRYGGPYIMNAQGHTEFVDAFHRDRANKIVIMTGAGGDFIGNVEWSSFGDVADPGV